MVFPGRGGTQSATQALREYLARSTPPTMHLRERQEQGPRRRKPRGPPACTFMTDNPAYLPPLLPPCLCLLCLQLVPKKNRVLVYKYLFNGETSCACKGTRGAHRGAEWQARMQSLGQEQEEGRGSGAKQGQGQRLRQGGGQGQRQGEGQGQQQEQEQGRAHCACDLNRVQCDILAVTVT